MTAHIRVVRPPVNSLHRSPRNETIARFPSFPTTADSAHVYFSAFRPRLPRRATMAYMHQLGTVGLLCEYPCRADRLPLPCPTRNF